KPEIIPPPPRPPEPGTGVVDPLPMPSPVNYQEEQSERAPTAGPQIDKPPTRTTEGPGEGPRIIEPELDARYPFSEPEYPVSEIRQGHEGTVLLALQILPNGRV